MKSAKKAKRADTPSLAQEIIAGLKEFRDTIQSGEALNKKYTVRTIRLDLEPRTLTAGEIKALRETLNLSQAIFAGLLGVNTSTVKAWEQGRREPSATAFRLLDEIAANPRYWLKKVQRAADERDHERETSIAN
jgi:putative transcriptional regulator